MKTTAIVVTLILAFIIGGCGEPDNPLDPTEQVLLQDSSGNFVLWVSNQSFDIPAVDIRVAIDGKLALSSTFEVKNQHNWIKHTFQLDPGKHSLTASSKEGEVALESEFEIHFQLWGVLNYWYYEKGGGNKYLEFRTQNSPILFI